MRAKWVLTLAAWAGVSLGTATAQKAVQAIEVAVDQPAVEVVKQPAGKAPVAKPVTVAADPTEPPMQVEVSYSSGNGRFVEERRGGAVRGGPMASGQAVKVTSGAKGTEMTLDTPGAWMGTAKLTFKTAAPPMRFTMKLARMPGYDLSTLTLTSGDISLQVGQVGTSGTTKYFDKKGQAQESPTAAAYTVVAKRSQNGEIEIAVRRGAGAALGKTLSVSWQSDLNRGGFEGKAAFVGRARMIIND